MTLAGSRFRQGFHAGPPKEDSETIFLAPSVERAHCDCQEMFEFAVVSMKREK